YRGDQCPALTHEQVADGRRVQRLDGYVEAVSPLTPDPESPLRITSKRHDRFLALLSGKAEHHRAVDNPSIRKRPDLSAEGISLRVRAEQSESATAEQGVRGGDGTAPAKPEQRTEKAEYPPSARGGGKQVLLRLDPDEVEQVFERQTIDRPVETG